MWEGTCRETYELNVPCTEHLYPGERGQVEGMLRGMGGEAVAALQELQTLREAVPSDSVEELGIQLAVVCATPYPL